MAATHVQDHNMTAVKPFASGQARARWVIGSLLVSLVLDLAAVIALLAQMTLLAKAAAGQTITMAEAAANDGRLQAIGALQILIGLITAVFFLMWLHRTHRNLPALGARQLQYSPGWAVGGFFVPFLCFVRPFQVVREIWKASALHLMDDTSWHYAATSPLLGWWWALFLVSRFMGNLSGPLALSGGRTAHDLLHISRWIIVTDGLSAAAALLAVLVVWEIDKRQTENGKRLVPAQLSPKTLAL